MSLEFSAKIFQKYSNIKFSENPSGGIWVLPCGKTDGRSLSAISANAPKTVRDLKQGKEQAMLWVRLVLPTAPDTQCSRIPVLQEENVVLDHHAWIIAVEDCRITSCNSTDSTFNPLNAELNPICYLLALLGAHHFLYVSRISVKSLTLRLLMSYIHIYIYVYIYIYGAPILDVSRSHTTTHHSR